MRRSPALALLACAGALACDRDRDPKFLLERKPVPEVRHMGFRQDIPDERRGNASFDRARFTTEGELLLTAGDGLRIWDARTGELLRRINGSLDGNDALVISAKHHRLLARRGDVAYTDTAFFAMRVWDIRDGTIVGTIPETGRARAFPVGITDAGEAVVFRGGRLETWALSGSKRRLSLAPPDSLPFCARGRPNSVSYNDKECFELSPSGRTLAVTFVRSDLTAPYPQPVLIDIASGRMTRAEVPAEHMRTGVGGFAFSPNERTIAFGTNDGIWLWTPGTPGEGDERRGPFMTGEHKRNQGLLPMTFTADGTRLVALGDQLQVNTYDVTTGTLVGRVAPPFEDWEGSLRVSADGSRAVAYRFVADILVVIDGNAGRQLGYVCPFFCNRLHNPVEVPYAVSPDGKRVASGGRLGAGLWDTDADTLVAPLEDPTMKPRRPRD